MPPKGSQKSKPAESSGAKPKAKPQPKPAVKAEDSESVSGSESGSESPEPTPKKTTTQKATTQKTTPKKPATQAAQATPRKKKEPTTYKRLEVEESMPVQIDVKFEGDSVQSQQIADGVYGHTLKLQAANPFKLVKTLKFTSGDWEGCEAILLQPARPFPFLKLPKEARAKIYSFYFAPSRVVNADIALEGKRPGNKESYAKMYSEGSRYRVALLAACKEVHEDAVQILYDHTMRFENTNTLLDFLGQLPQGVRGRLRKVSIKGFVKTSARNAMHFLAESPNIVNLHIETGVCTGEDPAKAAKEFYNDAYKFLEAVAARKGEKTAGVDVLTFGRDTFMFKAGDDKKKRPWGEEKREEFKEALRGKLNCLQFTDFACLCGLRRPGHSCTEEFNLKARLQKKHSPAGRRGRR